MKTKIIVMFSVLAFLGAGLFAHDVTGSDIVDLGKFQTVSGILKSVDGEWMLETAGKKVYDIHLGNYETVFPQGLGLQEGKEATVTGYALNDDIAVCQIKTGGSAYTLRDETTGRPVWAEKGNRKNQKTENNEGRGKYRQN
ncbi:MAG: hypothetical protein GX220_06000 [Treponema sp.]|nr:hypothetical protein [Treponema sp.]